MEVTAYTRQGQARKAPAALPEATFDGTVNEHALHQVVTAILAHRRQGTASTKTRGAVRGGGRKPWRQKGTGRARVGTIRSPLWRGGSVVFGPQPRDYDVRVPRKVKRLAIRSALNARATEGNVAVVEPLDLEEPRTKEVSALIEGIGAEGRNLLLLTDGTKQNVYLSVRNIPGVMVRPWGEASAYDILWSDLVVIEASALADDDDAREGGEA
jgi:large subunit ribosomal protein L4